MSSCNPNKIRIPWVLAIAATAPLAGAAPRPVAEAAKIPDIVQTGPALGLETIGRSYCGPASVATTATLEHVATAGLALADAILILQLPAPTP